MAHLVRSTLVLATLLSAAQSQNRTWIVSRSGGPGVDFDQIQPAIDTAQPGDRIVVEATGSYAGFAVTKGVDIDSPQNATVAERVDIQGVPAGQHARIQGLRLHQSYGLLDVPLRIQACAGTVSVLDCEVRWLSTFASNLYTGQATISVEACADVVLRGCSATGLPGISFAQSAPGCPALGSTDSKVSIVECTLEGGGGDSYQPSTRGTTAGGPALVATNSELTCSASTLSGGRGGSSSGPRQGCYYGAAGGPAARVMTAGRFSLFRHGSALRGGAGGSGAEVGVMPGTCGNVNGAQGEAMVGNGATQVTIDCTLTGTLSNAQSVARVAGASGPATATLGGTLALSFQDMPNQILLPLLDRDHAFVVLPGIGGVLQLTAALTPLVPVVVGAQGSTTLTLPVPLDGGLRDALLFFQGAAIPSSAAPALTDLVPVRLR